MTGLLAAGLLATTPATAGATPLAPGDEGSAYGLTATGPAAVGPAPAVSSASREVRKSVLREEHTKLFNASALNASAAASQARAGVARLNVPKADMTASAVSADCAHGQGASHLTNAFVAGRRLDSSPPPNTTVPVDVDGVGRASMILNKQQRMPDGRLAVTAMELTLPRPEGTTLRVASATCGRGGRPAGKPAGRPAGKPAGKPAGMPAGKPAEAPAPTPVERDLPVTG
ncbi:choice-of-anchor P family protein [Actinomadura rubrisoli]|nr:choice-of-anchor P family protein [Actinomadura rubrisoli]